MEERLLQLMAGNKLGQPDRLKRDMAQRPELSYDPREDITPWNLQELDRELARTKDPRKRSILLEEARRLKELLELHQNRPQVPTQFPPAMQRLPYTPGPWDDPRREIIDRRPPGSNIF